MLKILTFYCFHKIVISLFNIIWIFKSRFLINKNVFKYFVNTILEYISILHPNFDIQTSRTSFLFKTRKQVGSNQLGYTDTEIIKYQNTTNS